MRYYTTEQKHENVLRAIEWAHKNPEKRKAINDRYKERNPEKRKATIKKYYESHKDYIRKND